MNHSDLYIDNGCARSSDNEEALHSITVMYPFRDRG